ncbi:MAG: signal peptidase I [Eubacterium sp.]|nr:signal peptidase I [Eubacterium sp.]
MAPQAAEEKRFPTSTELQQELSRVRSQGRFQKTLRNTVITLIAVAAAAVLIAMFWLPVLRIYGSSMAPTLDNGNIVLAVKNKEFAKGDIVAFYYNNKILVKRVVAKPGDTVDIDSEGNVYVNSVMMEEPYLADKALGDCNIELPFQVPENKLFVLGDNREESIDSRNTAVGCVADEQIVGRLVFVVWPFRNIHKI